jgi:hypothetical protein
MSIPRFCRAGVVLDNFSDPSNKSPDTSTGIAKYSPEARSSSTEQNLLLSPLLPLGKAHESIFDIANRNHYSGHILLRRQQHPDPRGDDRERITRARQAAEALFTSKPPVSKPSVPETASPDPPPQRKPRVLRIIAPPAIRLEEVKAPVSPEPQTMPAIPRSHFPRIRTWVKYGMTISQVAEVYDADTAQIERILGNI